MHLNGKWPFYRYFYALLMALSALLLSLSSDKHLHFLSQHSVSVLPAASWIFAGTLLAYLIPIYDPVLNLTARKFSKSGNGALLISVALLLFISFFRLDLHTDTKLQYVLAGFLTLSYYTRISGQTWHFRGLRSSLYGKNIVLSLAWTLLTSPYVADNNVALLLFIQRFLFILALSILIDIRDVKTDRHEKTRTLPVVAGIINTKILAGILLVCGSTLVSQIQKTAVHEEISGIASAISTCTTLLTLPFLNAESGKVKFLLLVDGNLFLHGLLLYLTLPR